MMKKLSILLLILCVLILPAMALAANPTVEIGYVELPNGYYMASDTTEPVAQKPNGGYAHLKDGVLTLNNYSITSDVYSLLRILNGSFEIVLVGDNYLTSNSENGDGIAIADGAALSIGGTGSLTIDAPYGIYGYSSGGNVCITGGKITIDADVLGIYSLGEVSISGGELSIKSQHDAGIFAYTMEISGGKTTIATTELRSITATSATITGGDILINSPSAEAGLYAGDNVSILGGKIKITAENNAIFTDELIISGQDTVVDCTVTEDTDGALYVYDSLRIDSPLQIVKPEGGVIGFFDGGIAYTVLDAEGQLASHVYIAAPVVTPTPAPVPQTGDHADLTLWLALAVLTMTGMVLLRRRAYR